MKLRELMRVINALEGIRLMTKVGNETREEVETFDWGFETEKTEALLNNEVIEVSESGDQLIIITVRDHDYKRATEKVIEFVREWDPAGTDEYNFHIARQEEKPTLVSTGDEGAYIMTFETWKDALANISAVVKDWTEDELIANDMDRETVDALMSLRKTF